MHVDISELWIPVGDGNVLPGRLALPADAEGIVLFAHGSGSGRRSPRNTYVAGVLERAGLATLLFDLLTEDEERAERSLRGPVARPSPPTAKPFGGPPPETSRLEARFDIELLAERLCGATRWLSTEERTASLCVGYFGASTGGAAALVAAARDPLRVDAVVSRGGRPDLAGAALPRVQAPTLLIVGGDDVDVLELNRGALAALRCEKRLEVVPGASHLFEEVGALERVAELAGAWLTRHLALAATARSPHRG